MPLGKLSKSTILKVLGEANVAPLRAKSYKSLKGGVWESDNILRNLRFVVVNLL